MRFIGKRLVKHIYLIAAILSMWAATIHFFLTERFNLLFPLTTALFMGLTSYQYWKENQGKFEKTLYLLALAGLSSLMFAVILIVS